MSGETDIKFSIMPILDFPGYYVDIDGLIYGKRLFKPLKPHEDNGFYSVSIYSFGKLYKRGVAQLVMNTFVGATPVGMEILHKNKDRADNRLCNLEYGLISERTGRPYEYKTKKEEYNG